MTSARSTRRLLGLVLATAMTLAACGSDGGDGGGDAAEAGDTTSTTEGASSAPTTAVVADGSPIRIGFRNIDAAVPEVSAGFEVGVEYVNDVLGGVDGHPLEVSTCEVDATPERSIDCTNQFIEDGVVLSVQGADPSADAAIPGLTEAGIAEVGIASLGPVQSADVGHSFMFTNPGEAIYIGALAALQEAGSEKVRIFSYDTPDARAAIDDRMLPAAEELGLDAEAIYYSPGSVDWPSLASTVVAEGADGTGLLLGSEADCTAMLTALQQFGYTGPVLAGNCREFVDELGAENTQNVITIADLYPPDLAETAPPEAAAEIEAYVARMEDAGHGDLVNGLAGGAFSLAVTLADALSQIQGDAEGDLTAADILEGLPDVQGHRFMGGEYNCDGSVWEGSSSCQLSMLAMEQQEDGSRAPLGDGFLDLEPYAP